MTDILNTVYSSFGWSLLTAFLSIYIYLYACKPETAGIGLQSAVKSGLKTLIKDHTAQKIFLLCLYICMVFFRTLFNRNLWLNPLSNVFDGWWIWNTTADGTKTLSSECFENMALLMPVIGIAVWTFPDWFKKTGYIKGSFIIAGSLSLFIESCQLFFRLGTFQFSDLIYNTLGGVFIGLVARLCYRNKRSS
ncbi:VanZ family protein [Stecheria sp. CLA-KB-P133]|uniref:VanZ family protein n=1 Tax=Grylomicrobium aquisgranensis TaxID=2926318 RepID=A0AB35U7F6_9FIRM|nr:VanZ family protein [Stecheria sp. CLA-KB-P133]